jgi:hypothetical protein
MTSKTAAAAAAAWQQAVQTLGIPAYVYSDDGSEFKAEFKRKLDFYDTDKVVSRGHAHFAERAIRTIKEQLTRRLSAGAAPRNRWAQLLPAVTQQYNSRKHEGIGTAPNAAYSDPQKRDQARQVMRARAKQGAGPRLPAVVGDMVRVRVKPLEGRGSYRVTEAAWSERSYRVARVQHTGMGPLFTLDGWQGGELVRRDILKAGVGEGRPALLSREVRAARAARDRFPMGPAPV